MIDVAADISPEWGTALRAKREQDPQGLREAIASGGPRLLGLLVLKRNHPELYAIRVEDLRLQSELKALANEYRAAIEAGSAKAAELEAQLRQKVNRQVDLDLRARAIELKALDAQVRRMVDELTQEARDRTGRVDKVLEAIKAGEEPRSLVRPGFGSGERGGRSWRRPGPTGGEGNESRADPAPGGGSAPKNGAAPSGGAAKNGAAPSGGAAKNGA
ncbi:MAG: hypothetical protein FJ253_04180, partial [Phycisphaerae bacterium]|nr:hypothetical protein [Phycisphaerae bacterium]